MIMLNKIGYLANDHLAGLALRDCLVAVIKIPLGRRIFRNAPGPLHSPPAPGAKLE